MDVNKMKIKRTFVIEKETSVFIDKIYMMYFSQTGKKTTYSAILEEALQALLDKNTKRGTDE